VRGDANGENWSAPILTVDAPGFIRAFDPCLWVDPQGRMWLFWAQALARWDGRGGVWYTRSDNPDAAKPTWTPPRRISDGVMLNKPIVDSRGRWLLPIGQWDRPVSIEATNKSHNLGLSAAAIAAGTHDPGADRGISFVYESTDKGRTFRRVGGAKIPEIGHNEHMVVERRDGSLWMLARTLFGLGDSVSTDGGKTWSPGKDAGIPHPVSRFFLRRLASGALLLVRHAPPEIKLSGSGSRSHLTAFVSDDDGRTWSGGLLLDERAGVAYPDGVQAPDGTITVIYDRNRTGEREVLTARFREEDARAGRDASGQVRLRGLVFRGSQPGR
jgi:hypothetical protein